MTEEYRYGDNKTIHRTGEVNVERDAKSGKVVAVWYRCALLPFTDTVADARRTVEMNSAYEKHEPPAIKAIVFEEKAVKSDFDTD